MKKTTIALLTAAAMGTSGAVMAADHSPEFSGRIDFSYTNESEDGSSGSLSNRTSKLEVSGSGEGVEGINTFYYARLGLDENGDAGVDYALAGASGAFGSLQAGIDDDLVYKFAGAHTDVYRGLGPVSSAYYSDDFSFGDTASVQYSLTVDAFTFAAYADTAGTTKLDRNVAVTDDDGNETGKFEQEEATVDNPDGIERYQVAVGFDAGIGQVGLIYSDRDEAGDSSQVVFGGRVDLDMVSLRGHVSDDENGNNPYAVAAIVPLTDILSLTVGYGDDDEGGSSVAAMLLADLGGGLDVNVGYRNTSSGTVDDDGDAVEDAFNIGDRKSVV